MNSNYREIIETAYSAMKKWNILYALVLFPTGIAFFLFVAYYIPSFGRLVSQTSSLVSNHITDFEYHLGVSGNILVVIFLIFWFLYFTTYILSKRNRIKAYLFGQVSFFLLVLLVYYSMFYGTQFFVPFLLLRIIYWIFFITSIAYITYFSFNTSSSSQITFPKLDKRLFTNLLLLLWGITAVLNIVTGEFNRLIARLLLSVTPIVPILLMIFFTRALCSQLLIIKSLRVVNRDQEKYRQEFGYSVKDWYGKKSRQYKESLKNK